MTERLARAAAAHPWRTIGAWLAAILVAVALLGGLKFFDGLSSEGQVTNDPESLRAEYAAEQAIPRQADTSELVVIRSETLSADEPAFRARVEQLAGDLEATGIVHALVLPYDADGLVSQDGHAVLVLVALEPDEDKNAKTLIHEVRSADGDGFAVNVAGTHVTNADFTDLSQRDLEHGELLFGLPAALIVLLLVFGAVVAATLPLILALVSIAVALGLTALVGAQWELSIFVVNMLTGMGLALGIDYALFVVSRFREERTLGRAKVDAIGLAGATASRAVLFSGSAFVLAMTGLLLVQSTIMRSLAVGAIAVGVVSVVAALTLLPAALGLLGDHVNRLRIPFVGRKLGQAEARESRFWGALVRRVVRRPLLYFAVAAGLLVAAAAPVVSMNIGAAGLSTLPDSLAAKQGLLALERSFPQSSSDPALIVIRSSGPEVDAAVKRLETELAQNPTFGPPVVETAPNGELTLVTVTVTADVLSDEAVAAVRDLRGNLIPAAFQGVDAEVLVGGVTAENVDYFDVMKRWLPFVFIFVLGLSFVLLTVAFRSIVIAGTAIVLNLFSVGATYGLLVLVFQHGFGTGVLGFQQVDIVEAWVPLFLFAVLFGLSMDYQVFLLSRIRERYSQTGDTRDAIEFGISSTARIITGAALIIVAVFLGFAMGELVMFQQMGFGIAIALLIDATIVRGVLVPAAMTMLGSWNWYLPGWLQWLPHFEVEGGRHETAEPARAR